MKIKHKRHKLSFDDFIKELISADSRFITRAHAALPPAKAYNYSLIIDNFTDLSEHGMHQYVLYGSIRDNDNGDSTMLTYYYTKEDMLNIFNSIQRDIRSSNLISYVNLFLDGILEPLLKSGSIGDSVMIIRQ